LYNIYTSQYKSIDDVGYFNTKQLDYVYIKDDVWQQFIKTKLDCFFMLRCLKIPIIIQTTKLAIQPEIRSNIDFVFVGKIDNLLRIYNYFINVLDISYDEFIDNYDPLSIMILETE